MGGGYAGTGLLAKLSGMPLDVTMIDKEPRFFHTIGSPRALVVDGFEKGLSIPYDRLVSKCGARFLQATVSGVDVAAKTVAFTRPSGAKDSLSYDFLVIATGSSYTAPFKVRTSALPDFAEIRRVLAKANTIVVTGGGPVGIEVAGELASAFPSKSIIIANSGPRLLDGPDNACASDLGEKAAAKLSDMGVKLRLGERLTVPADLPANARWVADGVLAGPVTLTSSKVGAPPVTADAVIMAVGSRVMSEPFRAAFAGALDADQRLRVNGSYQVAGHDNVFAIGDVAGCADAKMAYACTVQTPIVAKNIAALARQGKGAELQTAKKPASGLMVVTLGPKAGVGVVGTKSNGKGKFLPEFMIKMIKGKDMFVARTNKDFGYSKPGAY